MSDSITITVTVNRPLGCPHGECEVTMSTDTFSSVGHYGFPDRIGIMEAVAMISVDIGDAVADELGVGYLWAEAATVDDDPEAGPSDG